MSMSNLGPIGLLIWPPPGGISQKDKSSVSEVTMTGRVTKLLLCVSSEATSRVLQVSDLTYFSRSLRSEFKISPSSGTFHYCLTQRAVSG